MRLGSFQLPNDASLSYAEYGTSTGKPVLLLHGLVGSICSEGMEESLCGLPMRVIALARPGYGDSDYFDMDCVADWGRLLTEFWDHLGLQSFDIVGISAGAPYAYSLAALGGDLRNIGQEAKLQEAPWGFELSEVRCPVVLLHGTADSEVPYGAMVETVKRLPHARIIKLEGEEHASPAITDRLMAELLQSDNV